MTSPYEEHVSKALPDGGMVLVLNTGAKIDPEAQAMLAALHSRSIGGIHSHLQVLAERGAENFMSRFYVGYGHKSIGDLGSVTVFIEGVSMLVAKAIQHSRLYNGQESSTRYIDFAEQPFVDPVGTAESRDHLERMRTFYLEGLAELIPVLKERHPCADDEKESVHEKAVKARAFDIMRSFLPAGAATNLAWHGPLRVMADHVLLLRHHPLKEVRDVAEAIESALLEAHPNSFSDKRYEATERYLRGAHASLAYFDLDECAECTLSRDTVDRELLAAHADILRDRPHHCELPKMLEECGDLQFTYLLDFGSFRDIQRHRAVVQRMPLLTARHGFHAWYLEQMPEAMRARAQREVGDIAQKTDSLTDDPLARQYYLPMGFLTANRLTGTLPALIYLIELRSQSTVHPTLRTLAQQMGVRLHEALGEDALALHVDNSETRFDIKRGEQDIVLRG